jgi:phage repressor protein C with HTH and peptisase S24 domain
MLFRMREEKIRRLRQAREKAGFRYASDAANALGMTASTYRAHENGQNEFYLDEAKLYGKKFKVDPLWLMAEDAILPTPPEPAANQNDSPNATIGAKVIGRGRKIKVYGRAVGGVDGEFEMNGSVLYETMAPPIISDISDAYAVQVSGDSMSPRYEDGEICFVDPKRRVKKGDYVIVQIQTEEHGLKLAYVKRFVRQNSEELVLLQFNPHKELRFPSHQVVSVHYIAMAGDG